MKLNKSGEIVTGFYLFDINEIYHRNDFVVKGSTIYVCSPKKKESVTGEDPEISENYYVYLGEKSASIEEYFKFIEDGSGSSKYITINTLQAILNYFMMGINSKGIIGDNITLSEDGSFNVIINNIDQSSIYTNPRTILKDIMIHEDINNGIFRVSTILPEIQLYFNGISGECILKQYTFINQSGISTRIQELIDFTSGLIYYRSTEKVGGSYTSPREFKCSIVNTGEIKKKFDDVLSLYSSRLNYLRLLEDKLKSNFRYRSIKNPGKTSKITVNTTNEFSTNYIGKSENLTILIYENILDPTTESYRTDQVSINLGETYSEVEKFPTYTIFDGKGTLTLTRLEDESIKLEVSQGYYISSLIYQEYYDN